MRKFTGSNVGSIVGSNEVPLRFHWGSIATLHISRDGPRLALASMAWTANEVAFTQGFESQVRVTPNLACHAVTMLQSALTRDIHF